MKHHKVYKSSFVFFLFFISYWTILNARNDLYECSGNTCLSAPLVDSEHREYFEIPEEIAQFIMAIFEDATHENRVEELPKELVHCYKRILNNERILPLADLALSLPFMFNYLEKITAEMDKAPRPENSNIVGPTQENLSLIIFFLRQLQQQLAACCSNITSEFQQTWTILANITTPTMTVDLSPVFTALNACCNNINCRVSTDLDNIRSRF